MVWETKQNKTLFTAIFRNVLWNSPIGAERFPLFSHSRSWQQLLLASQEPWEPPGYVCGNWWHGWTWGTCQEVLGVRACRAEGLSDLQEATRAAGPWASSAAPLLTELIGVPVFRDLLLVSWTPSQVCLLELMIAGVIILEIIIIIDTYRMPTLPGTLIDALRIFLPSGEKMVKKVNFSCSSLWER